MNLKPNKQNNIFSHNNYDIIGIHSPPPKILVPPLNLALPQI